MYKAIKRGDFLVISSLFQNEERGGNNKETGCIIQSVIHMFAQSSYKGNTSMDFECHVYVLLKVHGNAM